ncbi:hypothetical protein [Streptomyces sp. SID2119]|uniref:hypothetical protein n=1 Tax=Streptomyces sp. SID2119 TaxID=2690253 RepID=UPI00136ECD9F|nr:hypothetical protein [Streptomyces sp. SID2119]MYW30120.1 hypothetical protein [Streptomyces sp. SID2119]
MTDQQRLLSYARSKAQEIQEQLTWTAAEYGGGFWEAHGPGEGLVHGRVVAALQFLREYAGFDSSWFTRAEQTWDSQGGNKSVATGAYYVGELLKGWADQVEAGITEVAGSQAREKVGAVSTDVMEQVRQLNEDDKAHPAAAIVLCGAALETALRATVEARALSLPERQRPSLNSYTQLLRSAGIFTAQDVKDADMCGGLRNSAAHGHFDDLSRERAGLMEQQTNLLLRKLSDLATVGDEPE